MASNQAQIPVTISAQRASVSVAPAPAPAPTQEFVVRVPQVTNKKYSIMKFGSSRDVDFTKCGQAVMARENNLREFKQANDLDHGPKFGAGSEYGRERRDIARRKKYGMMVRKYKVDDQPWQLKIGKGKEVRKFKGTKEGGILDNASYYIFTKCPDGAFEAHAVEEWYNFNPVIKYKFLNSEEAEEEFTRRDKTLNYFSIMLKKRLNNDDDADLDGTEGKGKGRGKGKKKSDLMLTDMDDWAMSSDDNDADDSDKQDDDEATDKVSKKTKKAPKNKKKRRERKNSDDEAMEESDDMDEGQEVDYMTDTDSEDEEMYNQDGRGKLVKYEEKGVADEEGLRKQLNSDEEDEDEEKKDQEEEIREEEAPKEEADGSESDSTSSSESDSDEEKEENFSSALFMPKKKKVPTATLR